ncbi:hypothetical protein K491DRAFT_702806 [Lophiostoma macrostomum CBS 122681]|uniref:Sensor histidine kinase-like protein/response regulator n=1 Tax=Lophiostoma macrostomum CBS 122681 TaxID=1314788 RepID=A0A6A6TI28_9PLEO|nr:hypothetical protein K491DRAFT_702806 [Lophiostoma macrostomum CBS 122681]
MMEDMPRMPKPVTQTKRERDVFRHYGSCFQGMPRLSQLGSSPDICALPSDHVARASKDSALMAFAQLAAIRLEVTRAMISLIDGEWQHILAEATPSMSIRLASRVDQPDHLWLGNVSIPRSWGMCSQVLSIDASQIHKSEDAVIVINDLSANEEHKSRTYVQGGPKLRFYAGVPLTSPAGAIVGTIAILHDEPREGLSQKDIYYLQDLSATITEYLDTYTLKQQYQRGEQLTRGLISFSEGCSTLQPFKDETESIAAVSSPLSGPVEPMSRGTSPSLRYSQDVVSSFSNDTRLSTAASSFAPLASQGLSVRSVRSKPPPSGQHNSVRALQDSILPTNSKAMFARAAHIMRASSDLDGVIILDASVAATRQRHHGGGEGETDQGSDDESVADSSFSKSSSASEEEYLSRHIDGTLPRSSNNSKKTCQVLGSSTREKFGAGGDSVEIDYRSFPEKDLTRLLRKFPNGKVLQFAPNGEPTSEDSDLSASGSQPASPLSGEQRVDQRGPTAISYDAITKMLPQARSVAFVPFWDFERSRWFAGCLCYSNKGERVLTAQLDLAYSKIFSSSIMSEIARLDAMASSQAKTTFVASISHELRSPLHGILGTLQFMQDSSLDSFQVTMLNSMAACGQTLLDTLNHVLDYAKVNDAQRNISTKRLKDSNTVRLSSKPPRNRSIQPSMSQPVSFDLGLASEEVIEAVFAGQSYAAISANQVDGSWAPSGTSDSTPHPSQASHIHQTSHRKSCYIILDMDHEQDWHFSIQPGSFRRVLMNIFGNALKYTESGHIRVSLRVVQRRQGATSPGHVVLTITDSGSGMSPSFLANRVFAPFSQENPHSPGTGLGLSIVRQIIETVGGKVEISSDMSKGTKLEIRLALVRSENKLPDLPQRAQFLETLPRLERRRICILHKKRVESAESSELPQNYEGLDLFTDALATTLKYWLKLEVIHTSNWQGNDADVVICPEVSFEYLSSIRRHKGKNSRAPITIFVAMDSLEASTLRHDARVVSKESVVEIITQPCGPYKLANILGHCLNRFNAPDENIRYASISIPEDASSSAQTTTSPQGVSPMEPPPLMSPVDFSGMRPTYPVPAASTPEELKGRPAITVTEMSSGIQSPEAGGAEDGVSVPSSSSAMPGSQQPGFDLPIRERLKSRVSHVLITDDNAVNRRLLVAFLKRQNIQYQEAENGLDALQKYKEGSVRFDAILMDISMPVMDGMTATRRIREYERKHNVKRTFIVALTGLTSASARLEAWNSGIDNFMVKPIKFKALEQLLDEAPSSSPPERRSASQQQ